MKAILLKRKGAFALYVLASLLFVVSDMLQISVTALLFDALEKGSSEYFLKAALVVVGVMFLNGGLYLLSRMMRLKYMKQVLVEVRMRAFEILMQMSYRQFGKVSKEIHLSRLINDINTIESTFFISLVQFISNMGLFVVGIIAVFIIDSKLAIGTFTIAVMCYYVSRCFLKKTETYQEAVSDGNEALTLQVSNMFDGLEIIKLGRMEDKFSAKSISAIKRVEKTKWQFNCYSGVQRNALNLFGYVVMVGIIFYLGIQIADGLGLAQAVFLYETSSRLTFLIMNSVPLINVMRASDKIYKKITYQEVEKRQIEEQVPFRFNQAIEVRNMSFGYDDRALIQHAFFTIEKGKKYLIKGTSGTGKSSLVKLLGMVHDTYDGDIVVDGINYKHIDERSFNQHVAFIDQDIFLFEDSIRNNVTLYREVAEDKLQDAIRRAGLLEVVEDQEEGLEACLSENGKNLSGGQRQRIAIARALVKDAAILFVDEGTSSLNESLGSQIEKDLLGLDKTIVAISHRYYAGVSESYDYVLEIHGKGIRQYSAESYFEGVKVC